VNFIHTLDDRLDPPDIGWQRGVREPLR